MKALVALSGGMDSATLLGMIRNHLDSSDVHCVSFSYGSKHNPHESVAAAAIAAHYGVTLDRYDLSNIICKGSSNLLMSGGPIPEGHYEAETMKQTVVPGRNIIFISIMAGIAWASEIESIYLGIHRGDHAIYPDCRLSFFCAMKDAIIEGTDGNVLLEAPFINWDKSMIVKNGLLWDVPYHLTRTCYKEQLVACGKCGSCQERLEAFANNGLEDPIAYESRIILPKGECHA